MEIALFVAFVSWSLAMFTVGTKVTGEFYWPIVMMLTVVYQGAAVVCLLALIPTP